MNECQPSMNIKCGSAFIFKFLKINISIKRAWTGNLGDQIANHKELLFRVSVFSKLCYYIVLKVILALLAFHTCKEILICITCFPKLLLIILVILK